MAKTAREQFLQVELPDTRRNLVVFLLGNTLLVKLELWESVMVIISFGLPLTYAYATLRQSVAGNSTFRGILFCNLGTPKTVISNFVTSRQRDPIYFPIWLPQQCSRGTKKRLGHKKVSFKNVLIPS